MRLERLIEAMRPLAVSGPTDIEVEGLSHDSRAVRDGHVFFALRGRKADGHRFLEEALGRGAVAFVVEDEPRLLGRTIIRVADGREAMARAAGAYHGHPDRQLRLVGVTGTNGKTTVAFLLKHILDGVFQRAALLGTVRYEIGERILPAERTTPESLELHRLLRSAVDSGCRAAVMEVSSHALAQGRVSGIEFDVGVFTNLTQDHLDYHRTMDEYFRAKERLFVQMREQSGKAGHAVVNGDDSHGARLAAALTRAGFPVTTFGVGARCGLRASGVRVERGQTVFELSQTGGRRFLVRTPLAGRFNVYNALAALGAAMALGVDPRSAVKSLAEAPQVPGRLEALPGRRNFRVYVDYAHTPDALVNVLQTLREQSPRRLIVVFGCGGERDKAKRRPMAEAVERFADIAVVTSDNPRNEEPGAIIRDIVAGFRKMEPVVIEDRKEAIFRAVGLAGEGDIVLIAGKGHEGHQDIAGNRFPFNDAEVAGWALLEKPADHMRE